MLFEEKFYVIGRFENTKSYFIEKHKTWNRVGFNLHHHGKHICTFVKMKSSDGYYLSLAADNMEHTFDFYRYFEGNPSGDSIEIGKHYVQ